MDINQPLFSIVIPTRNRAHLLQSAIHSAVNQGFEDYEILVSDNDSSDNTSAVSRSFDSSRLRYVRTDTTLSMADHWEFAMDHARGRYVTYLCDDDCLAPDALQTVADAISVQHDRVIVLGSAVYINSYWRGSDTTDTVSIYTHTGRVFERAVADTLRAISACQSTYRLPRMLNCFAERALIQRVRERAGRIFLFSPDYSFAALVMSELSHWIYIDAPLRLQGVFAESIGASNTQRRGQAAPQFWREYKVKNPYRYVPIKANLLTNAIAETYLECKALLPAALSALQIDWQRYFLGCWEDLVRIEANGVNVEGDKSDFYRALKLQPKKLRERVLSNIQPSRTLPPRNFARSWARKTINAVPLLSRVEGKMRSGIALTEPSLESLPPEIVFEDDPSDVTVIRGEDAGFANILECVHELPRLHQQPPSLVRQIA